MLGTNWVTHSLGLIVAATVLFAAGSALAQSPAPPPEPPDPKPTVLSLFDNQLTTGTKPKSLLESWLSGVDMKCIGCGVFGTTAVRPESTNPNAPWMLQGRWRRQTTVGVVSAGFVGIRNYALPLSTAMPLGGGVDPVALGAAGASSFAPSSQWSLTAGFEKTLATRANGASVGVIADVLIPVSTDSASAGDPRISALASRTIRVGIIFRW